MTWFASNSSTRKPSQSGSELDPHSNNAQTKYLLQAIGVPSGCQRKAPTAGQWMGGEFMAICNIHRGHCVVAEVRKLLNVNGGLAENLYARFNTHPQER
jgi:hypothetical protein